MRIIFIIYFLLVSSFCLAEQEYTQEEINLYQSLNFVDGPTKVHLNTRAELSIPEGVTFLNEKDTAKYNQLNHNLPVPGESAIITNRWQAFFNFSETGYIKDDETLDAVELLKTKKKYQDIANKELMNKGWQTFSIEDWYFKPRYDKKENLLEWGVVIAGNQDKNRTVNYETRILGRHGVTNVILAAFPDNVDSAIVDLKKILHDFEYLPGEKYSEFKQGDRIAEFGLAALVAGGAAALATKKGFWAAIASFFAAMWKIIVPIFIIIIAKIGSIFRWIKSIFTK